MADNETVKRYMRQIAEDAARFEDAFDSRSSSGSMTAHDVMSSRRVTPSEPWTEEPVHQERRADAANTLPTNDRYDNGHWSIGEPIQRGLTREVSEALGHELSIQRRMRGL